MLFDPVQDETEISTPDLTSTVEEATKKGTSLPKSACATLQGAREQLRFAGALAEGRSQ